MGCTWARQNPKEAPALPVRPSRVFAEISLLTFFFRTYLPNSSSDFLFQNYYLPNLSSEIVFPIALLNLFSRFLFPIPLPSFSFEFICRVFLHHNHHHHHHRRLRSHFGSSYSFTGSQSSKRQT